MDTKKDFGEIIGPYDFFVKHSNEKDADAEAMVEEIRKWSQQNGKPLEDVRILDFGSGDGGYLSFLISKLKTRVKQIAVLDPVDEYRRSAVQRLSEFSREEVLSYKIAPEEGAAAFDIVISNHVFYYVPDLVTSLKIANGARKADGLLLITMATEKNSLIQAWHKFFASMGMAVPYNLESNLVAALNTLNMSHSRQVVEAQLTFENNRANQKLMARFLVGENEPKLKNSVRDEFFRTFLSGGGTVRMNVEDALYVLR